MEPKIAGGDATDCSRLAWLLIACEKQDRAAEIVDCGLRLEPNNEHCQNLSFKIWSPRLEKARRGNDLAGMVDAVCRLTPHPSFRFADISDAANYFNLAGREIDMSPDQRQLLARRLGNAMEPRIKEGAATDCSRLAWLRLQAGENERASAVVEWGLKLEPNNEHCLKLKTRLQHG